MLSFLVVVREFRKDLMGPSEIEEFIRDVEMLHNLNHPNVLQFIDLFHSDDHTLHLVIDSQQVTLKDYVKTVYSKGVDMKKGCRGGLIFRKNIQKSKKSTPSFFKRC